MAISSSMLPLGTQAPDFALPDTNGKIVSRAQYGNAPLLVMFICNHCPYVKHVRSELANIGREYHSRGVGVVGISSNDIEQYPADSPAAMAEEKRIAGYTFPYLYDESQEVARAYRAACTPDFFLFDRSGGLVYRGQLDDSRPSNGKPVTGRDLRAALDAVLADEPISEDQIPSIGCGIKWKPGSPPESWPR
jgi:peroxiredoxin